ncbi:hydrolase [Roseburia sp. AF15-21]|jgi:cell wall-associated NlpC family hydrolase|uniref:C40 family peptidase n=1 Tax=unclassified Roseburia TaxID=2637578 RepID=UPI000E431FAF|nr:MULTISPECIES: C40 family peptidase [unclassified Roseburia]RGF42722.1 hydrolase [Roseburia sp. AF42-8]RGG41891.1 hydrolase [Roseburia sp. AF22-8AC]RGG44668.1 hydrolase [Roseburia sp. AF22-2LB]RGH28320.1 hydrolase [Roseburia sp. AF02-12]RHR88434.1 hydrolase [Roseburia sp. AF15-21]
MHRKKHMWKMRLVAAGLVAILGISCFQSASASALSKAKNKKSEAQTALDNANADIENIQSQQQELQSQIDALDADLVNIIMNLDILEGELSDKQTELDNVTAQLAQAQEDEQNQYDAMKKRIVYMYENGDDSYIEALVGATDFSDLLNRLEYAQQIYDYDRNLLTQYQETVQQVADLKSQVETEKAELEEVQQSYQEQQASYESMIAEKQSQMSDFDTQLASAQSLAAQYKATVDEQNEIIRQEQAAAAAAAAQNNNKGNNTTTANNNNGNTTGNNNGSNTGGDSTTGGSTGGGGLNPSFSTSVSGSDVVSYACQFIGNPYVWGGESLTDGADCSGFIKSVYANFGISLPHSSVALQRAGSEVSYENAQPGDIVCYAGHVAIYMGGGQIVHASSPSTGIKTGSATYRSIISVRRVL